MEDIGVTTFGRDVTISEKKGSVPLPGGFSLPETFEARYRSVDWPDGLTVDLDVEVDAAGKASCRRLELRSEQPIDHAALRLVKMAKVLREVTAAAVERLERDEAGNLRGVPLITAAEVNWYEHRGGRRLTPEFLQRVAAVYIGAQIRGDHPTATVVKTYGAPRATVSRWVRMAREAGYFDAVREEDAT
jgi:hypothetical protein